MSTETDVAPLVRRLWEVVRAEHEDGVDAEAVAFAAIQVAACALLMSREAPPSDADWTAIWEVSRQSSVDTMLAAARGLPVFFKGDG